MIFLIYQIRLQSIPINQIIILLEQTHKNTLITGNFQSLFNTTSRHEKEIERLRKLEHEEEKKCNRIEASNLKVGDFVLYYNQYCEVKAVHRQGDQIQYILLHNDILKSISALSSKSIIVANCQ